MLSQLAKQSYWKLSADSSIAHEHIRLVNLPVNTFSNGTEKMAVEGKSLAQLLASYFLSQKKVSLLKWTHNCMCEPVQSLLRRGFCCESQIGYCLWCRTITNSCTCTLPGGGSYFPYILLNEIQTMFSQLAKQSHRKLSADCSIAHEHIRPVDLPVNTFSNGNWKNGSRRQKCSTALG